MKILVTGSEGFVGKVVVRKLLTQGHTVIRVDSLDPQVHRPRATNLEDKFHLLPVGYFPIVESYDAVIHLAAKVGVGQSMYEPAAYTMQNTQDTAMFLEKLTKHKPGRMVVASSMSVYGEGPVDLEDSPNPLPTPEYYGPFLRSIYALTKYDQEQMCLIWGKANKVPTVALRFFNIYGPGQALNNPYTGVLAIFASRLLNGRPPMIYEDGQQSRDFVHVEDVAEAVVKAATEDMPVGVYNVGTGVARTIEDVALHMAEWLGVDIKPIITGQRREGDIRHCYADITKIKATGWKPKVPWVNGIRRYCEWLKQQPVPEDKWEQAAQELIEKGLVT